MSEEEAYDHGFYDGLATAWQLMFTEVLGKKLQLHVVLKELAALRDAAREGAERHQKERDNCTCEYDEINVNCRSCF